jgi:tetratricopeptide (TPR) repeat protein
MRSGRTSRPLLLAIALTAFATAQFPEPARAGSTVASKDQKKAADLFKKSVDAYRKGDFQTTVDLLTQAYALDPQPVLLYNLARAQEGLGNTDAAIDAYEKFLAQDPKAADRGAIEQRLTTLRRQRDERIAAQKAREAEPTKPSPLPSPTAPKATTVPPPGEEPRPEPEQRTMYPYVVGGVGIALLGTGAVTGLLAKSGESDANAERTQQRAIEQRDSADSLAAVSTVTFIAGGILLAMGVGWFVLDTPSKKSASQNISPRVALGPGYIGLTGVLP